LAAFNRYNSRFLAFSADFDVCAVVHVAPCWLLNGWRLTVSGWFEPQPSCISSPFTSHYTTLSRGWAIGLGGEADEAVKGVKR